MLTQRRYRRRYNDTEGNEVIPMIITWKGLESREPREEGSEKEEADQKQVKHQETRGRETDTETETEAISLSSFSLLFSLHHFLSLPLSLSLFLLLLYLCIFLVSCVLLWCRWWHRSYSFVTLLESRLNEDQQRGQEGKDDERERERESREKKRQWTSVILRLESRSMLFLSPCFVFASLALITLPVAFSPYIFLLHHSLPEKDSPSCCCSCIKETREHHDIERIDLFMRSSCNSFTDTNSVSVDWKSSRGILSSGWWLLPSGWLNALLP